MDLYYYIVESDVASFIKYSELDHPNFIQRTELAKPRVAKSCPAVTSFDNTTVFMTGRRNPNTSFDGERNVYSSVEAYTIHRNRWFDVAPM